MDYKKRVDLSDLCEPLTLSKGKVYMKGHFLGQGYCIPYFCFEELGSSTIDNFIMKKRITCIQGQFAKCYKLTDLNNKKCYAGKIISKSTLMMQHLRVRISKEISIHQSLNHKHILKFYGYYEDSKNIYIILELCERQSLLELMKKNTTFTDTEARIFLQQLLLGVKYLHDCKIIHRDLKLANIFICNNMDLKIGDFGLATKLAFDGEKKRDICGTPNYMAPEILRQTGYSYGIDIWSVGCILYTLLVGTPPFKAKTLLGTFARIIQNDYLIPFSTKPATRNLLQRLLQGDPLNRPSVNEILIDKFMSQGNDPSKPTTYCLVEPSRLDSQLSTNDQTSSCKLLVDCNSKGEYGDEKGKEEASNDSTKDFPKYKTNLSPVAERVIGNTSVLSHSNETLNCVCGIFENKFQWFGHLNSSLIVPREKHEFLFKGNRSIDELGITSYVSDLLMSFAERLDRNDHKGHLGELALSEVRLSFSANKSLTNLYDGSSSWIEKAVSVIGRRIRLSPDHSNKHLTSTPILNCDKLISLTYLNQAKTKSDDAKTDTNYVPALQDLVVKFILSKPELFGKMIFSPISPSIARFGLNSLDSSPSTPTTLLDSFSSFFASDEKVNASFHPPMTEMINISSVEGGHKENDSFSAMVINEDVFSSYALDDYLSNQCSESEESKLEIVTSPPTVQKDHNLDLPDCKKLLDFDDSDSDSGSLPIDFDEINKLLNKDGIDIDGLLSSIADEDINLTSSSSKKDLKVNHKNDLSESKMLKLKNKSLKKLKPKCSKLGPKQSVFKNQKKRIKKIVCQMHPVYMPEEVVNLFRRPLVNDVSENPYSFMPKDNMPGYFSQLNQTKASSFFSSQSETSHSYTNSSLFCWPHLMDKNQSVTNCYQFKDNDLSEKLFIPQNKNPSPRINPFVFQRNNIWVGETYDREEHSVPRDEQSSSNCKQSLANCKQSSFNGVSSLSHGKRSSSSRMKQCLPQKRTMKVTNRKGSSAANQKHSKRKQTSDEEKCNTDHRVMKNKKAKVNEKSAGQSTSKDNKNDVWKVTLSHKLKNNESLALKLVKCEKKKKNQ